MYIDAYRLMYVIAVTKLIKDLKLHAAVTFQFYCVKPDLYCALLYHSNIKTLSIKSPRLRSNIHSKLIHFKPLQNQILETKAQQTLYYKP